MSSPRRKASCFFIELLLYVNRARASMRRHTTGRRQRFAGAVCRPLCGGGNTDIVLAGVTAPASCRFAEP
jgi:hypothetical protein